MKKLDIIAEQLFNHIRGRFPNIEIGDENGEVTNEPALARFYEFDYEDNGNKLGKVSVSLDETDGLTIIFSKDFVSENFGSVKENWYNFLRELRTFAKKRLMNFEIRDINRSNLTKRNYRFLATNRTGEQTMAESKMYGTNKTSFQKVGNARIAIKHKSSINTESSNSRTKNIGSIFIESPNGEKFRFPFKHLSGARAMARHVSEGGNAYDDFGKYITSLSEEMAKLRKFKQYMNRSSVMAESLNEYVDVVNERISVVKKTIQNLQKESFYKETFENFEVPEIKEVPEEVAENWIDQLTVKQFNEELKDVFPYIYNLVSENTKTKELGPDDLMSEDDDPCWKGYKQIGMKKKGGKKVPNCVPESAMMEADSIEYEVQPGDTVRGIVQSMNDEGIETDVQTVIQDNKLDVRGTIRPGQMLIIREPSTIGAGGTSELAPNGQRTGSTRGVNPPSDFNFNPNAGHRDQPGHPENRGLTGESLEDVFDEMMGQFSEGNKFTKALAKARANNDDEMEVDGEKIPVSEFILSYFDRHTGQFPKGETAVLTMVEKEYGKQYIKPAQAFIERINNKVAEVMGYKDTDLGEEESELDMVDFDDREHRLEKFLKRSPDGNGNVWSLAGKKFFYAPGNREAAIKRALIITDRGYDYTQIDHMLIGPIDTSKYSTDIEENFFSRMIGANSARPADFVRKATEISNKYQSLVTKGTSPNAGQSSKMLHDLYMELINMSREIQKMGGGNKTMINAQQQMSVIKAAARGDQGAASKLITAAQSEPKFIIDFVKQDIASIGSQNQTQEDVDIEEGFLSNLVGDVRNAFKPGVAVTPNMVRELESGLAAIKSGGQPTPRQQKIFDRFMSDTLPRELQKMGINVQKETQELNRIKNLAGLK